MYCPVLHTTREGDGLLLFSLIPVDGTLLQISFRLQVLQIISYSDTKVPVLVVMECKQANVIYLYELIFLLHASRSTECRL